MNNVFPKNRYISLRRKRREREIEMKHALQLQAPASGIFHDTREELDIDDEIYTAEETDGVDEIEDYYRAESKPKSPLKMCRDKVGAVVNDERIQAIIIIFICVNSVMMGIATFDVVMYDPEINSAFEYVDKIFLVIFTVELVMQLFYHGFYFFRDGWLDFDFVIIVLSWMFQELQIIRAFRIFRALRIVSKIKVMREIVSALLAVIPRMTVIAVLLIIINYIFSVMFTSLFRDAYPDFTSYDYFSRLELSAFTLFQIMTLDNWAEICKEVQELHSWAWAPFIVYVIISAFVVVNLMIAVVCDAIAELNEESEEEKRKAGHQDAGTQTLLDQMREMEQTIKNLQRSQERMKNMLSFMNRQFTVAKSVATDY